MVGSPVCSPSTPPYSCTVTVQFAPNKGASRPGALIAQDGTGAALVTAMFQGGGWAPQPIFLPGKISTVSTTFSDLPHDFNPPAAVVVEPQGRYVFVSDKFHQVIRKIDTQTGTVTIYAGHFVDSGGGIGSAGYAGDGGPAVSASLHNPAGIALDPAGNLYIADEGNNVVREVDGVTGIISTVAGVYSSGDFGGDGGPATEAHMDTPESVAVDPRGNLYIADRGNNCIREVTIADHFINTIAGNGAAASSGDGGLATNASFNHPSFVAVDQSSSIYVTDASHSIRKFMLNGNIQTIAGTAGVSGYSGDGGNATDALLNQPTGLAFDSANNVYFSDYGNCAIRKFSSFGNKITTLVGKSPASCGYSGDAGDPTQAAIHAALGVTVAWDGTLYIADSGNNAVRAVSYASPTLTFLATSVGTQTAAQTVEVANVGTNSINLAGLAVTGNFVHTTPAGTDCFSLPGYMPPSESCQIAIAYNPPSAGTFNGIVTVTSADFQIWLRGSLAGPIATLSPASLSFGNQALSTASASQVITLTNTGGQALSIASIAVAGTNAGDFTQNNNCGASVAANASCSIHVTFAPSALGARSALLTVVDNASGSPHTVALGGTGIGAIASLSPLAISFPGQALGIPSAPQMIALTNTGNATLTITGISVTGANSADFSQTSNCSSVAASASCTIQVTFTASAAGNRVAALRVADNASGSPQSVALTGTGTAPQIVFSPAALNFGSLLITRTSPPQIITLTNSGNAPLGISGISLAGPNTGSFSQTNSCSTLVAGASCAVTVSFTPSAAGSNSASLIIATNAPNSPATVALTGTGAAAGSPSLFIDTPTSLSGPVQGPVSVAGWAGDNFFAISNVTVAVDGFARGSASYGGIRPDVCHALPALTACPNVGWTYLLDTGLLSNGTHSISVTATTADGRRASTSSSFKVANWASSGNALTIAIDKPATTDTISGLSQVAGWAISQGQAVSTVAISVDGVKFGSALYGGARADVCKVYPNRPSCPNVGWNFMLNSRSISDGAHTLAITATTVDGQSSTMTRAITIANLSGSSTHITIDRPNASTGTLSGAAGIGGWAFDDHAPLREVDVLVDGSKVGTAGYGGLRTDVCAVHPGKPGCPSVGWNYTLDTTRFTNGTHSLEIQALTISGTLATVSTSFTVSNGASTTRTYIDSPGPQDGAYQGVASFTGWALDDTSAISTVEIAVDGVPVSNATYSLPRPDVCLAYPNRPGCPNVGWTVLVDTTQLSNGKHSLGVTGTTADGRSSTASSSFSVANWTSVPNQNGIRTHIDSPNSQAGALSGVAHLGGWALSDYAAIASVQIAIDNVPFGSAGYGASRPDVCAASRNHAGCPNVGWDFLLDTTALADGSHALSVTGVSSSGQAATITATFTVGNLPATAMRIMIDTPSATASALSGKAGIGGWALADSASIETLEVRVDGMLIGNAAYGDARKDVCSVLPGRPGCPNVGWNYLLDTTQLANGTHTLQITGVTSTGQRAAVARSFSVSN